jgi:tetratricopeptide (TPR) repeat protein
MTRRKNLPFCLHLSVCLTLFCAVRLAIAEDTNTAADPGAGTAEAAVISNQSTLRSTLEIQEQLHNLQLADEKERRRAEAEAASNTELLNQRLDLIESSLASEHVEGLQEIQHSNEMVLVAAGVFACFGFLVLLLSAFLQWQTINRIKLLAATIPSAPGLASGAGPAALGAGNAPMLGGGVERPTAEFLGAIERLERRIHEMESEAQNHHALPGAGSGNGGSLAPAGPSEEGAGAVATEAFQKAKSISLLLGKGQTQLRLDQPEAALASFDMVLAMDPGNTEAMLKRGAALERLQRLNEAIESYDRAIATDQSMTMAYLHKGGVFNRMERYSEALECYEQALKSQEKVQAAEAVAG